MTFDAFFRAATLHSPFPFQRVFAAAETLPTVLEAPTGSGKTATATLGWLWRRRFASEQVRSATPRRLIFCLPMRSLVSQTGRAIRSWLERLDLSDEEVSVHELLGGAVDNSFDSSPERDAVLIGTQDQLLSRALNRGYAVSRYRWPMHYGLLNNDCLWVLDEIQLMGVGLSTSSQLDAFRQSFATCGPASSLWMSATLDLRLLETVDNIGRHHRVQQLSDSDRQHEHLATRLDAHKALSVDGQYDPADKSYPDQLAATVLSTHEAGTRTLVVVNRVGRAQAVYSALRTRVDDGTDVQLLHSRFRPRDRQATEDLVFREGWSGILVATQTVEAGVDISSKNLFTELASAASLTQRFGRCNRRGEYSEAHVVVIDIPRPPGDEPSSKALKDYETGALPYTMAELDHARQWVAEQSSASPNHLRDARLAAVSPAGPVLRRRDALELFDTTPDLNGRDLDVSRWVRDAGTPDVQFAWRAWDGKAPTNDAGALQRDELCTVPIAAAIKFLERTRKKTKDACWSWDSLTGQWQRQDARLVPGHAYLLATSVGGYSAELGWTGDSKKHMPDQVTVGQAIPQDDDAADRLTMNSQTFVTLAQHSSETRAMAATLQREAAYDLPWDALVEAAHWHDRGKAHEAFQEMLLSALVGDERTDHASNGPWAKSDGRKGGERCARQHFRHELASALAYLEYGGNDLSAYLIAAHHGKVRMSIRSRPTERPPSDAGKLFALGVHDGDTLPASSLGDGLTAPPVTLDLSIMQLGRGSGADARSWTERALGLLDEWGPFRLALMETLVRVADWRASGLHSNHGKGPNHA